MRIFSPVTPLLITATAIGTIHLTCGARPGAAQTVLDEGTLLIRRGQVELGRETFLIRSTPVGPVIETTAFYPPRRTKVILRANVTHRPDSMPQAAQFRASNGDATIVGAQFDERRVKLTRQAPEGVRQREFRAPRRALVADDSLFALYAIPPGLSDGAITIIEPRHETRSEHRMTNRGIQQTTLLNRPIELTELVLSGELGDRHLWYDDEGRLQKVEISYAGIVAERISNQRTSDIRP